jgi:hypothetical protein
MRKVLVVFGVLALLGLGGCGEIVYQGPSLTYSGAYYDQDEVVYVGSERYYYRYYPSYGGWIYVRPSCWDCTRPVWYSPNNVVIHTGPWVTIRNPPSAGVRYMHYDGGWHHQPPTRYVPPIQPHRHVGGLRGDRDRDGIPNRFDPRPNNPQRPRDTDRDGIPDRWDPRPNNPQRPVNTRHVNAQQRYVAPAPSQQAPRPQKHQSGGERKKGDRSDRN